MKPEGNSSKRKGSNYSDVLHTDDDLNPIPPQSGYKFSIVKALLIYPLAILPLGTGLLLAYWYRALWVRLTYSPCPLSRATTVIMTDAYGQQRVSTVQMTAFADAYSTIGDNVAISASVKRYLTHCRLRYLYSADEDKFVLLRGHDCGLTLAGVHESITGLSGRDYEQRIATYGINSIDVPVKPILVMLYQEVLTPFYAFQILCLVVWYVEEYYYYGAFIIASSLFTISYSLFQTHTSAVQLHELVRQSCTVDVIRDGKELHGVSGESLVPGDVMVIPPSGMSMPCDAVLLTGTAIVNEASLTGESIPVTKTPLPQTADELYSSDRHKQHTLFGGTCVIQTRFYNNSAVLAVATRTAFSTSKGSMVRSILYQKPFNSKFYRDAFIFIGVLGIIAAGGFLFSFIFYAVTTYTLPDGSTISYLVLSPRVYALRGFDLITIVVPPALPVAITIGTVYAVARLKKASIFCIAQQRVNLCGKIKLVCFDKTGTLTEDSVKTSGVITMTGNELCSEMQDPSSLPPCPILFTMATCHSLTWINGTLQGDPLELDMFETTKWTISEPGNDSTKFDLLVQGIVKPPPTSGLAGMEMGIMKQFPFSSELQRMCVLARALDNPKVLHVYVKGAPEKVKDLCRPETVPVNFKEVLRSLTQRGLRVLAVAHRFMELQWHKSENIDREMVECDLEFSGLIIMKNSLKPETTPVISVLKNANIRTVMVTGDNLLTAVCVARECGMIPRRHRAIVMKAEVEAHNPLPVITYEPLNSDGSVSDGQEMMQIDKPVPVAGTEDLKPEDFHLIIDGKSFAVVREHCSEDLFNKLLVKGAVFARMSPDQKAQLVLGLQNLGYGVGMCGDGANDCGALKAAHAGISLSEAEASVASPFTSKVPNITCVPKVIMEGRAALTTMFSVFKFMALYALTQFISATILYVVGTNLGDFQYLYIDFCLATIFVLVMGLNGPYPALVKQRPEGRLASVNMLVRMVVHVVLIVGFQVAALYYLKSPTWAWSWYKPFVITDPTERVPVCLENTVIFTMASFQYTGLAFALSIGPPYRKATYTNLPFLALLAIISFCNAYMILTPWGLVAPTAGLHGPPATSQHHLQGGHPAAGLCLHCSCLLP
eukprot:Em0008g59a